MAGSETALEKRLQAGVRRFLLDNALIPADRRLVLAVSGGPDSTALLLLMARLSRALRLRLHVAYFDHGLRGEAASRREASFVQELARSLELPCSAGGCDVGGTARKLRLSVEDAARRERYAFLARLAEAQGIGAVATGHTASDQAETVLMHLIRGSGLAGLAGIPMRSAWPFPGHRSLSLVRPLLRLSRQDMLAYCAEAGIEPIEDESNLSPDYQRNRVRHELLPLMRDLNPRIEDALVRLAESAAQDLAFVEAEAASALAMPVEDGAQELPRKLLESWAASPRRHALRLALGRVAGDTQDFGETHLAALERLVLNGKTGDRLDLPRGIVADLTRLSLHLRLAPEPPPRLPDEPLALDSTPREFGPIVVAACPFRPDWGTWAEVDEEAVSNNLHVRRRRQGDRFQPVGMQSTKKLQDFFVDEHVPRGERDNVPVFACKRGIAWVGGLRIAEWARPRFGHPTVYLVYSPLQQ